MKDVTMIVVVRVPNGTTAAQARREVQTLINEKTTFNLEHDEIRAVRVSPKEI